MDNGQDYWNGGLVEWCTGHVSSMFCLFITYVVKIFPIVFMLTFLLTQYVVHT